MKEKPKRVPITFDAAFLKNVDDWRRKQRDRPSRSVAIRQLAERGGLAGSTKSHSMGSKRRAAEMASIGIEHLDDQSVDSEERARRKRRLIQGPREFRDIRRNRSKAED